MQSAQSLLIARKREIFKLYQSDPQLYNMSVNQVCIDNISAWTFRNHQDKLNIWPKILQAYQDYELDKLLEKNSSVLDPESLDIIIRQDLRRILSQPPSQFDRDKLKQLGIKMSPIIKLEKIIKSQDFAQWYKKYEAEKEKLSIFINNPQPAQPTPTKMVAEDKPTPVTPPPMPAYIPPKPKTTTTISHLSEAQKKLFEKTRKATLRSEARARLDELEKEGFKNADILEKDLLQILLNLLSSDDQEYQVEKLRKQLQTHNRLKIAAVHEKISSIEEKTENIHSYEDILSFLSVLQPINIWKLKEKHKSSQFKKIAKALYVLGLTGAGKTTLILWLLGYQFKNRKDSGINYFEAINVKPAHAELVTSISATSVTSKLANFPLRDKISIVDTTGDLDTQGVETELANQLMITNSYKHCEGIAYLMLQELAPLQGTRCHKIVQLAKRIAERFPYKDAKQLKSFLLIVFNNKNNWDENRIEKLIKDANQILQQETGKFRQLNLTEKQLAAFDFIIQSLKNKLFLDVGNDTMRDKILKIISDLKYGKNELQFSLEESTKTQVANCAKVLRDNVEFYLEKKKTDTASFYYGELCLLHSLMKDIVDSEKLSLDRLIIKKSEEPYNLFDDILKQAVDAQLITPESLQKLDETVAELRIYGKLANLGPKQIKSFKDIKIILDRQTGRLLDLIKRKLSKDKIQTMTSLCYELSIRFKNQVGSFIEKIQKICCKKLKDLHNSIAEKWKIEDYGSLDEIIEKYQMFELFYRSFEKNSGSVFCFEKSELKAKSDIIKGFQAKIQERIGKLREALTYIDTSCRQNQSIENKNIQYLNEKSEFLSKIKAVKALELEKTITDLEKEVMDKLKSLNYFFSNSIQSLFYFGDNFGKTIESRKAIRKNYEFLCQKLSAYDTKQQFKRQMEEMHNRIKLLRQKWKENIEEIIKDLEEFKQLPEKYKKETVIRLKAAAYDSVTEDTKEHLIQLINSFFTKFTSLHDKAFNTLSNQKLAGLKRQEVQALLRQIQIIKSYVCLDPECQAKFKLIIDKLGVEVKACCLEYSRSVFKNHVEDLRGVENSINNQLYNKWNTYYQNILVPFENIGFFTPYIESHKTVYQAIFDTFLVIEQTCIDSNKDKIKGKLTVLTPPEAQVVKLFTHVFKWIDMIIKNAELYSFINNTKKRYGQALTLKIEVIQEKIRDIVNEKAKEVNILNIKYQARRGTNLIDLNNLKNECNHWSDLYKLVNNDDKDGIQQFNKIIVQLNNQINRQNGKLQDSISTLLDPQTNLLRDYLRCQKLYYEYKRIVDSGLDMNDSFTELLEQIQKGVQQQIYLVNDASSNSETAFDKVLFQKVRQTIQLYEMLNRLIEPSYRETHNILFFNYLRICIENQLEKYQQEIDSKFVFMRSLLESHKIDSYQSEAKEIKKFIELINFYDKIEQKPINSNLQSMVLLQTRRKEVEVIQKKIVLQPFRNDNLQKLRFIYEKASQSEKASLRTKIRNKFDELLYDYQTCTENAENKAIELREWYNKIPNQLANLYKFERRVDEEEDRRKRQLQDQLSQLSNYSIAELSDRYEKYLSMRSSNPSRECLKQLNLKLDSALKQSQQTTSIVGKINIYRESIWAVKCKNDTRQTIQLKYMLEEKEKKILHIIKAFTEEKIKEITDTLEEVRPFSLQIEKTIIEIQRVESSINGLLSDQLITENFKQNSFKNVFDEKMSVLRSEFNRLCPLNAFVKLIESENINYEQLQKTLLKCYKALTIYKQLLVTIPNNIKLEAGIDVQGDSIDIEGKPSCYQLSKNHLDNFLKYQVHCRKNLLKQSIVSYEFSDANNFNLPKATIKERILKLNQGILILSSFEKVQTAFNNSASPDPLSETVKLLQDKLFTFINQIKLKFDKALSKVEEKMPIEFGFLQNLLDILNSNEIIILKIYKNAQQSEDIATIRSKPSEYLAKLIEKKVTWLNQSLFSSRTILTEIKSNKDQIMKSIQKDYKNAMEKLSSQKQRKISQSRQSNLGKEQIAIKQAYEQLLNFFTNQQKNLIDQNKRLKNEVNEQHQTKEKKQLQHYTNLLYTIYKLSFELSEGYQISTTNCEDIIQQQLQALNKKLLISKVSLTLDEFPGDYGNLLKRLYSQYFRSEINQIWIQKTKAQDLTYVLKSLSTKFDKVTRTAGSINITKLEVECHKCSEKFNQLRNGFKSQNNNGLGNLIKSYNKTNSKEEKIAIILAVWSIIQSPVGDDQSIQIRPHPVQIAALMILAQTEGQNITPKMAEVLTGEGKSIILATLSCYFAKKGYKVSVACYSEHLSKRDYSNFTKLFTHFEVKNNIFYGTFNQICERVLNSERETFKEMIYKLFVKKSFISKAINTVTDGFFNFFSKKENNKMLLLVDQFDVFFDKEYCGELFRPMLTLNDKYSKNLIFSIWQKIKKNPNLMPKEVENSSEFKELVAQYPQLESIFQNQIHGMVRAAKSPDHPHIIKDRCLMYQDKEKITDKLSFGFQTVYLNCLKKDENLVSQANLDKALLIPLIVGEFLYTLLPTYFNSIIGISGTINTLSKEKFKLLNEFYKIEDKSTYLLPSIYGKTQKGMCQFQLCKPDSFYRQIIRNTEQQLKKGRPVIICFATYKQLNEFRESKEFKGSKIICNFIHELQNEYQRDKSIKSATFRGNLTLMTARFSRGTDFVVFDKNVREAGGLHLVLAYIPDCEAEFVQFLGRTGRQGENGSVTMIVNSALWPTSYDMPKKKQDVMDMLQCYWQDLDQKQTKIKKDNITKNQPKHEKTIKCLRDVQNNMKELIELITQLNFYQPLQNTTIKAVVGLDGTKSMKLALKKIIQRLTSIMVRMRDIQKEKKIEGEVELQIIVYRNYNSGSKIIEKSEFEKDFEKLIPFLNKIQINGGWGREAIETVYQAVNRTPDVNMLILIGDAPPNTPKDVAENRAYKEWKQFQKTPLSKAMNITETNAAAQQAKFSPDLVINSMYICNQGNNLAKQTKAYFTRIAKSHKGEAAELNFSHQDAAERLTEFFTTKILLALAGNGKKDEIESFYQQKYRAYS